MSNIKIDGSSVLLCCGKNRCPALSKNKDDKTFSLTDDFGGKVKLTKEQLQSIQEALNHFDKS